MKKIAKYTTIRVGIMLVAGLSFGACKDFLDIKPVDSRVEENFYKTQDDATEALTAVYDVLQWHTGAGGGNFSPDPLMSDVASDDAYAGGGSRSDSPVMIEIDRHKITLNNTLTRTHWANHYTGIYRANLLLSRLGGIDAPESFKNQLAAEAKFLRANFYFELVRAFENIPLILTTQKPSEYCGAQAAPKDTYAQIVKDLNEAIDYLPASTLKGSQGHATKWAAKALLARVFLFYQSVYKQDITAGDKVLNTQSALAHLKDVISSSGHDLLPVFEDVFRKSNEFSIESVWEVSYSDENPWWDWGYIQGGEGNMQPLMQGPRVAGDKNFGSGWSFAPVSQNLVNAFEPNDPRKNATIIFPADLTGDISPGYQHTGYFSKKYTTSNDYAPSGGQYELNWGNNYRAIRFADVLLMAAELDLMAGGGEAQTYYNRVRDRVKMPHKTVSLENIFKERRVELALEGQRYWDLLRMGTAEAAKAINAQSTKAPGYTDDAADYVATFNTASKGFWPIPQSERDMCTSLKQNEGY